MANHRFLVLGPTYRRNSSEESLIAIERYDGVFFRVARKHLKRVRDVDVVVMVDDLTLVDSNFLLHYVPPSGGVWGRQSFSKDIYEKARMKNEAFLNEKLGKK